MNKEFKTVDDYILSFPKETQVKLLTLRQLIKEIAPNSIETVSYGIAAYKTNKNH